MQKSKKIKKIAIILASQPEISQDIALFLSKTLTRSELKLLGKHLRLEMKKKTVLLTTPNDLSAQQKDTFTKMYQPLVVKFMTDSTLGGGMRVVKQDTVIDMSVKHYIIQMVQDLTQ